MLQCRAVDCTGPRKCRDPVRRYMRVFDQPSPTIPDSNVYRTYNDNYSVTMISHSNAWIINRDTPRNVELPPDVVDTSYATANSQSMVWSRSGYIYITTNGTAPRTLMNGSPCLSGLFIDARGDYLYQCDYSVKATTIVIDLNTRQTTGAIERTINAISSANYSLYCNNETCSHNFGLTDTRTLQFVYLAELIMPESIRPDGDTLIMQHYRPTGQCTTAFDLRCCAEYVIGDIECIDSRQIIYV